MLQIIWQCSTCAVMCGICVFFHLCFCKPVSLPRIHFLFLLQQVHTNFFSKSQLKAHFFQNPFSDLQLETFSVLPQYLVSISSDFVFLFIFLISTSLTKLSSSKTILFNYLYIFSHIANLPKEKGINKLSVSTLDFLVTAIVGSQYRYETCIENYLIQRK